jgi:hypothetical protein
MYKVYDDVTCAKKKGELRCHVSPASYLLMLDFNTHDFLLSAFYIASIDYLFFRMLILNHDSHDPMSLFLNSAPSQTLLLVKTFPGYAQNSFEKSGRRARAAFQKSFVQMPKTCQPIGRQCLKFKQEYW